MYTIFITSDYKPNVIKWANSLKKTQKVEIIMWDRYGVLPKNESEFITLFKLKVPHGNFVLPFFYPFWWIYVVMVVLKRNPDTLNPFDLDCLIPSIFVKVFKNVRVYYTIADFYADTIPLVYPNFIRKFLRHLERYLLQKSDHVFLVDENRFDNVRGCKIKGLSYIYNSPVDKKQELIEKSEFSNEDRDQLNIFYAGLLDDQRGIRFLIDAVIESENINLKIAGKGPLESYIKSVSDNNPEKVSYLGFLLHDEILRLSCDADAIVAFYDPKIPINQVASPNKLFEAMMLSKPIIANKNTSMDKIVSQEKCGILIEYGNISELKNAFKTLIRNKKLRKELGINGRKAYEMKYSWKIMEKRLMKVFGEKNGY